MTPAILLLIIVLIAAMVLFSLDLFPAEVVAIAVMLSLVLGGVISPSEAFAGFGSETSITIFGLLVLSSGLTRTGVVHLITRQILARANSDAKKVWWIITGFTALMSSFMANTATAAFFTPVTLNISKRLKINPSSLLMPMAFASILASSVTLIATSTNLVVSGVLQQYQLEPIGMFELTPVGIVVVVVGLLYMFFIGQRLIPLRGGGPEDEARSEIYYAEGKIPEDSNWAGKTLKELQLGEKFDVSVVRIIRANGQRISPRSNSTLQVGDRVSLEGNRESVLGIEQLPEISFVAGDEEGNKSKGQPAKLAEILLMPGSRLLGRTLRSLAFRERFGLQVLGIHRRGKTLTRKIGTIALQAGDQLLIQGDAETIAGLSQESGFKVLDNEIDTPVDMRRARWVIGIFTTVMALAALNLLELPVAVMLGVLAVFITRTLSPTQAYQSINWGAWLLICSMLALGKAIEVSGFANLAAELVVTRANITNPTALLAIFFALAMALTQPMSNQAAAVVIVPIAIQTAQRIGVDPRPFAMMIAVGAACSFITPLEPACLMVYGPGNYRFFDFAKVGGLLTLAIFGIAMLMVPMLWPF